MSAAAGSGSLAEPTRMASLAAFRDAVRHARRHAGHTQRQLARSIQLHPDVLSHKLNGHDGWLLTTPEVTSIVGVLAVWGGIRTRAEAEALLRLMSVPARVIANQRWDADPLQQLETGSKEILSAGPVAAPVLLKPNAPPDPLTPLIGRGSELAAAIAAVRSSRLVTLTGVGGIGKTRVALEVAAATRSIFADGVAFANLAPLTDPALVGVALARSLGLSPQSREEAEDELRSSLREARVLMLVDNMEHLLDASRLLGRLLAAAPRVHMLVTSRVPLNLYGERQLRVPPLSLPADATTDLAVIESQIRTSEAVRLFLERAQAVSPAFSPRGDALQTVSAICATLDGLPLAIELAAVKIRTWSLPALLDRLDDRLPFLVGGSRDLPDRHRTLAASLAWSDALLSSADREVFAKLGVFSGWFDTRAAAAVVDRPETGMLDQLTSLADQSLLEVHVETSGEAVAQFRMLESVRQYALAQLSEAGAADARLPPGSSSRRV